VTVSVHSCLLSFSSSCGGSFSGGLGDAARECASGCCTPETPKAATRRRKWTTGSRPALRAGAVLPDLRGRHQAEQGLAPQAQGKARGNATGEAVRQKAGGEAAGTAGLPERGAEGGERAVAGCYGQEAQSWQCLRTCVSPRGSCCPGVSERRQDGALKRERKEAGWSHTALASEAEEWSNPSIESLQRPGVCYPHGLD